MENFIEKQEKFDKLISELNSDLVCGATVGSKIQDSKLYTTEESSKIIGTEKYKIGCILIEHKLKWFHKILFFLGIKIKRNLTKKNVIVDPYIKWGDLRIFDTNGVELINLSNFGFHCNDMI